jgi:hypothetical protein
MPAGGFTEEEGGGPDPVAPARVQTGHLLVSSELRIWLPLRRRGEVGFLCPQAGYDLEMVVT